MLSYQQKRCTSLFSSSTRARTSPSSNRPARKYREYSHSQHFFPANAVTRYTRYWSRAAPSCSHRSTATAQGATSMTRERKPVVRASCTGNSSTPSHSQSPCDSGKGGSSNTAHLTIAATADGRQQAITLIACCYASTIARSIAGIEGDRFVF